MGQQSVSQAARRSALGGQGGIAQGMCRPGNARVEGLAVAVLTALGERNAVDALGAAGDALRTMADDKGRSMRETVDLG
jgi:hypothetical protein